MKFSISLLYLLISVSQFVYGHQTNDDISEPKSGCALKVLDAKEEKSVCVCNDAHCDDLVFDWPTEPGSGLLVQSTKAGLRFAVHELKNTNIAHPNRSDVVTLTVNPTEQFQTIMGFGGAFTDAAGIHIQNLPDGLQRKLMENYFGKHGSQYTIGRVVISGADFSTRAYSYDDVPAGTDDFNLTHWALAPEDHAYKIPVIQMAQRLVQDRNASLRLFGSSWSPPAFLKTSKSLVRGHLLDTDQVYRTYAQYLVNFYEAYKKLGINFWGGTVQNEPMTANSPMYSFNSLQLDAAQAAKFIGKYLGPALVAHGYTKDKFKLMINDDNIDTLLSQVPTILADKDAAKYVAGLAFHWYNSGNVPYDYINQCHDKVKDKIEFMLMTEACIEPKIFGTPAELGNWNHGERYANDIIQDLWRHSIGWVDWNLVLDERGGPNWVNNFVNSPIIVNKNYTEFYKQPMYYVLAHFSRFFKPGSVRVALSTSEGSSVDSQLLAVAVHKKDTGHVVVNILNKSTKDKLIAINVLGLARDVVVQQSSITTVVLKL